MVELESDRETVFAGVLDAYSERGYDMGYRRAVADIRALLSLLANDYLRERPDTVPNGPKALVEFKDYVDRHLHLMRRGGDYVSDGLGI